MRASSRTPDVVVVVGGGVIGLAVAWRARLRGLSVSLYERRAIGEDCASRVAAGMLAPVSEVEFGEVGRRVLELGVRSAAMWPAFAAELELESGIELGLRARRLLPSAARALEPALAPTVRLALEAPDDHSVDPRQVLGALRRAC